MSWQGQRVIITGAGGFIGSHLAERLVALGARVRAFVRYTSNGAKGWLDQSPARNDIDFISGDLRDSDSVRHALRDQDVVFHLGALIGIPYSYEAPQAYVRTNIEGTLNVLEAARTSGARRVVHTSTSEVYGSALYVPIDEKHPLQAQSPYAATKTAADMLARSFYLSFGLPVVTIRPFNTYGPRQSTRAVIPTIVTQALRSDRIRLGTLAPTRDLNYVADTVSGFIAAGEAPGVDGLTVNVGSGREISIGDLASLIVRIIGRDVPIELEKKRQRPEQSEVDRLCAANDVAKTMLHWQPAHTLEQGLEATIAWLRSNSQLFRPDEYSV